MNVHHAILAALMGLLVISEDFYVENSNFVFIRKYSNGIMRLWLLLELLSDFLKGDKN